MDPMRITDSEFSLMREFIEQSCGILLINQKAYLIESRLTHLLVETGSNTFMDLYQKARSDSTNKLRNKIIDAMTTNETLWFRDQAPFDFLRTELCKRYHKEFSEKKRQKLRIWSAASSTGQEPYSIAMSILEYARLAPSFPIDAVEIQATDISPTALFLAKAGRYDQIAISRGLTDDIRARYFTEDGKSWKINDNVKKLVTLKKLNLQDSFAPLGQFDIIFCRNVAIYFSDTFKSDLFRRFSQSLARGGYFIVGASESLSFYSNLFKMQTHNRLVYYQVKDSGGTQ